jgi:cytochrome c553
MRQQRRRTRASRSIAVASTAAAVVVGGAPALADPKSFAYGEYLSQQCTSCHRIDGRAGRGIPPIVGLEVDYFVTTMKFYQTGARDNEAMVSVAKSLDEEALKALAIYFGSLKPAAKQPAPKKR